MDQLMICVNGFPRSGKDSFVMHCINVLSRVNVATAHISTVDPAKEALRNLGWDGIQKTPRIRNALHELKMLSNSLFDGAYEYVAQSWHAFTNRVHANPSVMFVDSREPEELERLQKDFGAICILVRRPNGELRAVDNDADQRVLNFGYDYIIENDGTLQDLDVTSKTFVDDIRRYMHENRGNNSDSAPIGIRGAYRLPSYACK